MPLSIPFLVYAFIAGVSMRLEPGVMREMHWHATAAEWAFVIEGRVRTTVADQVQCRVHVGGRDTVSRRRARHLHQRRFGKGSLGTEERVGSG